MQEICVHQKKEIFLDYIYNLYDNLRYQMLKHFALRIMMQMQKEEEFCLSSLWDKF